MKKYAVLGIVMTLALAGCKGKQEQIPDLKAEFNAAGDVYRRDCPLEGDPPSMKQNGSAKCVAERQHLADLQKQIQDEERVKAKID